jgi:hypothetical protein
VCKLCNCDIGNSDSIALNDGIVVMIWKGCRRKQSSPSLRYGRRIYREKLRKIKFSQDYLCDEVNTEAVVLDSAWSVGLGVLLWV